MLSYFLSPDWGQIIGSSIMLGSIAGLIMFLCLRRNLKLIELHGRFCEIPHCEHHEKPLNLQEILRVTGGKNVHSSIITTPNKNTIRVCDNCRNTIEFWKDY